MLSYCFLIISLGFWDKQVNKLISVIIPVFNVEKYIRDCIDSLTIQVVAGFSFEESVEVIFIDDGSPDNSVEIIREYQNTYKNIYIIQQENAGQSVARNNAIKIASGEYVFSWTLMIYCHQMRSLHCTSWQRKQILRLSFHIVKHLTLEEAGLLRIMLKLLAQRLEK